MNVGLGKLSKVDLRTTWRHEALDFTTWLSKEENLSLLSDEIGVSIKLIQTEAPTGDFNVDILAQEENTGRKIIIENQLEETNHEHLGKLITYAAGHDASIVIWIVDDVRDEHKEAIDWLNENTESEINFFLIKMELWKIGDSQPAPKFHIISKPNDWKKIIKESTDQSLTQTKISQLELWNKFKEYVRKAPTSLSLRKAYPQHWYDISLGSSEAHIALTVNTKENCVGCELYIHDNKEMFSKLKENKDMIEKELGIVLNWEELPGKKASRIEITKKADSRIIDAKDNWDEYFEWLKNDAEKFKKVFSKYISQVQNS